MLTNASFDYQLDYDSIKKFNDVLIYPVQEYCCSCIFELSERRVSEAFIGTNELFPVKLSSSFTGLL